MVRHRGYVLALCGPQYPTATHVSTEFFVSFAEACFECAKWLHAEIHAPSARMYFEQWNVAVVNAFRSGYASSIIPWLLSQYTAPHDRLPLDLSLLFGDADDYNDALIPEFFDYTWLKRLIRDYIAETAMLSDRRGEVI